MIATIQPSEEQLQQSIEFIRKHTGQQPRIGLILGSGLGGFADTFENADRLPTSEIPHYPRSTVSGHKGVLVFGEVGGVPLLGVQGRTHYYEGHPIAQVAYVVRLMARLGVEKLIVTNAAGATNPRFRAGDLMAIDNHVNFLFRNPLVGPVVGNEPRWADMWGVYHPPYVDLILEAARELKISMQRGVLWVSAGPGYETAAEVKMIHKLGGDAASMSTVPEVLVANANGIKVAGISCITNMGTGLSQNTLSHQEVTDIADQMREKFQALIATIVTSIDKRED